MMNNLPNGWIDCTLDDLIITLESGSRPKGGVRNITKGIPSIGGEHLNYNGKFNFDNIKYVPNAFAKRMNMGKIEYQDILIVKDGATTGKTSYVDIDFPYEEAVVNEHVFICRPSRYINSKYLFWYLWSDIGASEILKNFKGSAQGGINRTFATNTRVILPPFKEQNQIVDLIESLMGKIEKNKNKLNEIPSLLKRFRQAVINNATSEDSFDKGFEWREFKLGDVLIDKPKNGYSAKPVNYETSYKVLTLTATTSGVFNRNFFKYFDEAIELDSSLWLRPNDILVQRGNTIEYVGVSAIYDGPEHEFIYPDLMIKIRANEEIILTKYLYYILSSDNNRNYFRNNATGISGSMPKINQPTLVGLQIKIPSINEQKLIIEKVENLFSISETIQKRFDEIFAYVSKLPNAILNKAFSGRLTKESDNPIDPAILLPMIKEERSNYTESRSFSKKENIVYIMEKKLTLSEIIEQNGGKMTPYDLWKSSSYSSDIDLFYAQLKYELEDLKTIEQLDSKELRTLKNENR